MAGNLRAIADIQAEVETAGFRGINAQTLLDTLQSLVKVAGTMSLDDPISTPPIGAGWNRVDIWDQSRDTQGVKDGLDDPDDPGGWYRINRVASGDYSCNANLRFTTDLEGLYQMRIARVDENGDPLTSSDQDVVDAPAGVTVQLTIVSALIKNVDNGNKLQVEVKGPNGAVITGLYGQFGVQR